MDIQFYKTRDMCLAACLMVDGVRFIKAEKDEVDSRRLLFVFENNPSEIGRIVVERANATHVASTVQYDDCLRRLKTIIHGIL